MSTKKIVSGEDCLAEILAGVDEIAGPVGATLGPAGRTVIIGEFDRSASVWNPYTTKDGATVAASLNPEDPIRALAANLVKQAAIQTALKAGDGTTTATVISRALVHGGISLVRDGANPHELKKGMEAALSDVKKILSGSAVPMESNLQVLQVATISANGNVSTGDMVAEAYSKVNKNGQVVMAKSKTNKTYVESASGMQINGGALPQYFNDYRNLRYVAENPAIFYGAEVLAKMKDLEIITKYCVEKNRSLVLIADEVTGEALHFLMANRRQLNPCIISLNDFGRRKLSVLKDMESFIGGHAMGREINGKSMTKTTDLDVGGCEKIEVYEDRVVIIGGAGHEDNVKARVEQINTDIQNSEEGEEKEWNEGRLANLIGGVACIYIGANTDAEARELVDRYEDAIKAVNSARKGGVLPGGGISLVNASIEMTEAVSKMEDSDFKKGYHNLVIALLWPLLTMVKNAGHTEETWKAWVEAKRSMPKNEGWNIKTGEKGDMYENGIIDPCYVQITALENAVSVSGALITSSHVMANVFPPQPQR